VPRNGFNLGDFHSEFQTAASSIGCGPYSAVEEYQGCCVHIHRRLKCVWEVFVWGFGVLFLSCACVSVSGLLFSVGVCVCDLFIFFQTVHIQTGNLLITPSLLFVPRNGFNFGEFRSEFQTAASSIGCGAYSAVEEAAQKRHSAMLRHLQLLKSEGRC